MPDQAVRVLMAEENGAQVWLFLTSPAVRRVSALANWYSFDWAPVFVGAHDGVQRERLLDAATGHLLRTTGHVDLYPVEHHADLIASLRRSGWFAVSRPMGGRHLLRRNGRNFATYWAGRPGHLRALVRRKSRNSRYALSITDTLTDDLWQDYCDVHGRKLGKSLSRACSFCARSRRQRAMRGACGWALPGWMDMPLLPNSGRWSGASR